MNGFDFLDLVIGLIFIYLIYSIGASTLWEIFVNITRLRGKMLYTWVMDNFKELNIPLGTTTSNQILDHPMITSMSKKGNSKPSYISSKVFTDVLVDLVIKADNANQDITKITMDLKTFRSSLATSKVLPQGLKTVFLQYADEASDNLQKVKDRIGNWYDEAQERLLGSYKKNLQKWILVISLVLVGSTNADTIKLASYLYNNNDARNAIANKASLFVQDSSVVKLISRIEATTIDSALKMDQKEIVKTLDKDVKVMSSLNNELKESDLPLGWSIENFNSYELTDYLKKFCGLLLTILAVSMGSPFWFDILSKLSNLRAAGNKPKLAITEKSEKKTKKN
jgi:hypothetical protein